MASLLRSRGKPEKSQTGVQSVEIGLRIVAAMADASRSLMLSEIAKAIGMPAAKVHRYLVSLARAGMVEQESAGARYALGPLALRVGLSALRQLDVVRSASEALADLRDRTDLTAILSVYGSAGPTIVRWEECNHPVMLNAHVGSVLSLLDSASGRVFAAYLPPSETKERFSEEMMGRDPKEVQHILSEVRAHGMSFVRGSELASVNAMGAPVFDQGGKVVAVMALLGARRLFPVTWDSPSAVELRNSVRQASERLGYRYPSAQAPVDGNVDPLAGPERVAHRAKPRSISRQRSSGAST